MSKTLYPNTTQVPNILLDNMIALTNSELRIALLITRKTIGWHKETDYLSYTQIKQITGLSKQTVSTGVQGLIKKGIIKRVDANGESLKIMPTGFRGKVFYTLSKQLVKNLDRSKKDISTGVKIRPNKTNSYKTNYIIGGATKLNKRKNGDNSVDKVKSKTNGLTKINFDTFKSKPYKFKNKKLGDVYSKTKITTPHQAWGYLAVDKLNLPMTFLPRVIKSFKGKNYVDIKNAISKITVHTKLRNANDRAKYLFKII